MVRCGALAARTFLRGARPLPASAPTPGPSHAVVVMSGPAGNIMSLAFDSTGNRLTGGVTDGSLWIWETTNCADPGLVANVRTGQAGVYAVAFSRSGDHVLSGGPNGVVQRWPVRDAVATVANRLGDGLTESERLRYLSW